MQKIYQNKKYKKNKKENEEIKNIKGRNEIKIYNKPNNKEMNLKNPKDILIVRQGLKEKNYETTDLENRNNIIKKREKCLDVLSTEDGEEDEDSNDKIIPQKKFFSRTKEKSNSLQYRNRQSSVIISSHKILLNNKNSDFKGDKIKNGKI